MRVKTQELDWWLPLKHGVICGVVLLLTGMLASPWQRAAWSEVKANQPELNLEGLESAMGQGLLVGLLGGFRTIMADFLFIAANLHWEQRDRAKTETMLQLVTSVDPRPLFFWMNGARMIALDIPIWRIRELGHLDSVPDVVKDRIFREQAQRGIALLEQAEVFHPDDFRIPLEKAQIHLNRLKDKAGAAEWYLEASGYPDAPHYIARIYAELLRDLNRNAEAYYFLRDLYRKLSDADPMAAKPVVLERIRQLESELALAKTLRMPLQPSERNMTHLRFQGDYFPSED